MGLFDKLFGLKKKETPQEQKKAHSPVSNEPFKPKFYGLEEIQDQVKREFEIKEEKRQKAIAAVPGSEKYSLEKYEAESNAHIMTITEFTPVSKERFVVFDLETTGLDCGESEIIEIGAVRVENGEITAEYSQLVKPYNSISAGATAVNHITEDMVANQPMIYEVLPSFLTFVGDDVLAAHNVRFDYGFLAQACMRNKFRVPEMLFDTMALTRYYPEAESKKLTALVEAAGIEIETAHRALSDARMTAKLIIATNQKRNKKFSNASRCNEEVEIIDHNLSGLRFCVSGEIPGYERADLEKIIKQHDGRMTGAVSGKTDYLVLGTYEDYGPNYISGKQKAAMELINNGGKIQIINAEQFFVMVNNGVSESN